MMKKSVAFGILSNSAGVTLERRASFGRGDGLDYPQRSLPTPAIL